LRIKDLRVLKRSPGELRERLSVDEGSGHLLSEPVLLAVGCVPDVIRAKEEDVDGDVVVDGPSVF
jgi:hypothetical protein